MKVLVANLGSTSFKYRLFEMLNETELARGGVERIGATDSPCRVDIGSYHDELVASVPDHATAVQRCFAQLTDRDHGCLTDPSDVSVIGFKTVHGGRMSGVHQVNHEVLEAMEEMAEVAPAHNPPYVAAMRSILSRLPDIPLVAAFETDFHATIPERHRRYAVPGAWSDELHVKKWGFHGASHRFIAERSAELFDHNPLRVISCHLGGSSSLCAILNGRSVATTMGMSPQSGLPQNNRSGDFDPFALPWIMRQTGLSLTEILEILATQSGLLGISGVSGDIRDLEQAAEDGNRPARLALDVYISEIRRQLGGLLVELGGAEAIVFTGGIGEHGVNIREAICANLSELGIVLDRRANAAASDEQEISSGESRTHIWVIPTNEELIVARQTQQLLES